jgi:hypothetical protein
MRKEDNLSDVERKEVRKEIKKVVHETARSKAEALRREYKKQVSTAIITAFGLVIALVWKDVVTAILPTVTTPTFLEKFPLLASLYTAMAVTAIIVVGIILISNWAKSPEEKLD